MGQFQFNYNFDSTAYHVTQLIFYKYLKSILMVHMIRQLRNISWNECLSHISKSSCWIVIDSVVYDVTKFISQHPGGQEVLLEWAGDDATRKFDEIDHSEYAKSIMTSKAIGKIQGKITQTYSRILKQKKQILKDNEGSNAKKEWTLNQVLTNTSDKKLIVIDKKVYDVSNFANQHPGGADILKNNVGKDATQQFNNIGHSEKAKQIMEQYFAGHLINEQDLNIQKSWLNAQSILSISFLMLICFDFAELLLKK